ncbi:MAG: hypothetical protein JOY62_05965 [Acidobacteriaceae bacterium]|nr:hypothetical protein [Acidobacteriaceae bacterium]MBV9779504.1 hypothetical protein [Acidobacteriaceae bacterium]
MKYLEGLNQLVRRLRQYRTENEWASAILDSASQFGQQIALFSFQDGNLRLRGQRGLNLPGSLSLNIASAAAFQSAISSRDSVIALRTAPEVGESLCSPDPSARAYIIPIENGSRVVALLFVAGKPIELNAIDLIAGVASMALEREANRTLHTQIAAQSNRKKLGAEYPRKLA